MLQFRWRMYCSLALLALCFISFCALAQAHKSSAGKTVLGRVIYSADEIQRSNANRTDQAAIMAAVTNYWQQYLLGNTAALATMMTPDVRRLSQRVGSVQDGMKSVLGGLQKEWEAFERPKGLIAEAMTLRYIDIDVDSDDSRARIAIVRYWVEIVGGSRWNYEDQGLLLQVFAKHAGQWQLSYQSDSWNLNYDLDAGKPGEENFEFDFVYPVKDLARAVRFYTPLMGTPTSLSSSQSAFNLGGPHFILDATRLQGLTTINPGKPAGYAIFYVDDLEAAIARLLAQDVEFIEDTDTQLKLQGADRYAIAKDPAENLFVLMQKEFSSEDRHASPQVLGFRNIDDATESAKEIAEAWLQNDVETLGEYLIPKTAWFDDLRSRVRGVERGEQRILASLESVYWAKFDRGASGLKANMQVSAVNVRPLGTDTLVSYLMTLSRYGAHAFKETAFVTLIFAQDESLKQFMMVQNNSTQARVIELDYSGYPTPDLRASERFYTEVMDLGKPYTDSEWRGYWSNKCVFGVFTTDVAEDGLPRRNNSNGYLSVWVRSAQDTYNYLKANNASFPIVPAINSKSGLEALPGYQQVYATDSEGNGLIFTEYTGRRK